MKFVLQRDGKLIGWKLLWEYELKKEEGTPRNRGQRGERERGFTWLFPTPPKRHRYGGLHFAVPFPHCRDSGSHIVQLHVCPYQLNMVAVMEVFKLQTHLILNRFRNKGRSSGYEMRDEGRYISLFHWGILTNAFNAIFKLSNKLTVCRRSTVSFNEDHNHQQRPRQPAIGEDHGYWAPLLYRDI